MAGSITNNLQIRDNEGVKLKSKDGYLGDDFYASEVARGNINGASLMQAYGKISVVGATSDVLIQPSIMDGVLHVASSGTQMSIVSTSAQDGVGGTGIRSIHLHYIDVNGDDQNEDITLNGTTPVNTVATNIKFVQCMHIDTFGTGKAAAGDIICYETGGSDIYSAIPTGDVRCSSSARYIPSGKRLMIKTLTASSTSGSKLSNVEIKFSTTYFEGHDYTNDGLLIPNFDFSTQDNSISPPLDMPIPVKGDSIVAFVANSSDDATINASFYGYIENE